MSIHVSWFSLALCTLVVVTAGLSAQDWADGFEDYAAGEGVDGKGIWETWDSNPAVDGTVVDHTAATGDQSLELVGDNDLVARFTDVNEGAWEVKAKVLIPGGAFGIVYFILMNAYDGNLGANDNWALQLNMDTALGTIALGGTTLPLVTDDWAEIRVVIDMGSNSQDVYYDDQPLAEGIIFAGGGSAVALAAIDLYSGTGASEAYWDDVSVTSTTIPPAFLDAPQSEEVFWPQGDEPYTRTLTLRGSPTPTLEVVEPAGATITPEGVLTYALPDPLPDSFDVTVRATNAAGSDEASWTVVLGKLPPEGELAVAGELFVSLTAEDDTAGDDEWTNEGTLGDFERMGDPLLEEFGGVRAVNFNSVGSADAYVCFDDTPEGLVGLNPTRSIEVWAYNPATEKGEETLVAWGKRGGPNGTNVSFGYGTDGRWGAVGHWGGDGPDLGWNDAGGAPEGGMWHHLVYTYDGTTTRVYADGALANSEELGAGAINTFADGRIALAAQWMNDGVTLDPNQGLVGTLALARVRVHDGVLNPAQIAHNFDVEREEFQIDNEPPSFANVPDEDFFYPETVSYTYVLQVNGVPIPDLAVVEPAGALIGADGAFSYAIPDPEPASFTVRVTATNAEGSDEATWVVQRVEPEALQALPFHRYSFTDDATDSIGGAHGEAYGPVTFEGGQALLNNTGNERSDAGGESPPGPAPGGYIDLPNALVTDLEDQASFEFWTTWNGPSGSSWQRIFDFGTSEGGENLSTTGNLVHYIFLTPRSGNDTLRFGYNTGVTGGKVERNLNGARLPDGAEQHIVITWDGALTTTSMFLNGQLVEEDTEVHFALSDMTDVNNWLGRSQFGADALYNGNYNEVRIYGHVLNPREVLGNFDAGPDTVNFGDLGVALSVGDVNNDGAVNIADAISLLSYLFSDALPPPCMKAGDANDDDAINIADAISILGYLFGGGSLIDPEGNQITSAAHPGCAVYDAASIPDTISDLPGCEVECTP